MYIKHQNTLALEVLLYVRKNLEAIPFVFLVNQIQKRNNALSSLFAEGDGMINYDKPNLISQAVCNILSSVKKYKQLNNNTNSDMNKPLKVMILEDVKTDQELVKRQILKYNPNSIFTVAKNKSGFYEKIDWFLPDLILADYNLMDFTGLEALVHIKENKPFIPVIFVTGGLDPRDPVAEVVLKVADDFILKENIQTLHCRIKKIMDANAEKANKFASELSRRNNQKIKILKTVSLLENASDFSGKEELMALMKSLEEDLYEEE